VTLRASVDGDSLSVILGKPGLLGDRATLLVRSMKLKPRKLPAHLFWLGIEFGVGVGVAMLMVGLGTLQFVQGMRRPKPKRESKPAVEVAAEQQVWN
jgi:hypothetical protein